MKRQLFYIEAAPRYPIPDQHGAGLINVGRMIFSR